MIIDCDTHVIPRDAFDYLGKEIAALRPVFHFDDKGHYWHCDFPGRPEEVPGTTRCPASGERARTSTACATWRRGWKISRSLALICR